MTSTVLLVCEGNVCRSPMAQALLARQLPNAVVISAGLGALSGRSADPIAVQLLAERGIDIRDHIAVNLSLAHIRAARVVLTMTQGQRKSVEARYPFAKGRVYCIGEHEGFDVIDPYRHGRATFEAALRQIERGIERWVAIVIKLIS